MSLIKSASVVSLLTLASRVTGLVRDQLIAAIFGASAYTDAYNVAFRIPNMFRRFFAEGAFSQAFVPSLGYAQSQQGDAYARLFVDKIATVLLWVMVVVCIIGVVGAPFLVWLIAGGLQKNPQAYDAATLMARWMFPYLGLISMAGLAASVLNTHKHFAMAAAAPVLLNVAMIAAVWGLVPLFQSWGILPIMALAAGVVVGGILQVSLQFYSLSRIGRFPKFGLSWTAFKTSYQDPATKGVARLFVPALLGVGVSQISLIINTQIASRLTTGSVTWLNNADRLMEFPTAMLGVALGVVLMPRLSAAKAKNQTQDYSAMLDWGLRLVVVLAVPCAVALLLFALPLAATIFHYGAYKAADVLQTSYALQTYGVGLLGLVAVKVLAPGFYAGKDIKTPVKIAVVVLIITQLLNLVLVPLFQHAGLALSIAIGALINALWLLVGLIKKGLYQPQKGWWKLLLQVSLASTALAGVLFYASQHWAWIDPESSKLLRVAVMAIVLMACALLYPACLWLTGVKIKNLLRPVAMLNK